MLGMLNFSFLCLQAVIACLLDVLNVLYCHQLFPCAVVILCHILKIKSRLEGVRVCMCACCRPVLIVAWALAVVNIHKKDNCVLRSYHVYLIYLDIFVFNGKSVFPPHPTHCQKQKEKIFLFG